MGGGLREKATIGSRIGFGTGGSAIGPGPRRGRRPRDARGVARGSALHSRHECDAGGARGRWYIRGVDRTARVPGTDRERPGMEARRRPRDGPGVRDGLRSFPRGNRRRRCVRLRFESRARLRAPKKTRVPAGTSSRGEGVAGRGTRVPARGGRERRSGRDAFSFARRGRGARSRFFDVDQPATEPERTRRARRSGVSAVPARTRSRRVPGVAKAAGDEARRVSHRGEARKNAPRAFASVLARRRLPPTRQEGGSRGGRVRALARRNRRLPSASRRGFESQNARDEAGRDGRVARLARLGTSISGAESCTGGRDKGRSNYAVTSGRSVLGACLYLYRGRNWAAPPCLVR